MSDKAYKGVVSATFEKDWTDRDTGDAIVLRSFKIDGENQFFRTGTTDLKDIREGNYISFTADARSGNVDFKSVEKVEGEAPARAPKPTASRKSSGSASSGGGRNDYWEQKAIRDVEVTEPRISYSAAQKNATALVTAALTHDLLSFGNAAKGKRLDMLVDFVEETTLRLAKLQLAAPEIINSEDE